MLSINQIQVGNRFRSTAPVFRGDNIEFPTGVDFEVIRVNSHWIKLRCDVEGRFNVIPKPIQNFYQKTTSTTSLSTLTPSTINSPKSNHIQPLLTKTLMPKDNNPRAKRSDYSILSWICLKYLPTTSTSPPTTS